MLVFGVTSKNYISHSSEVDQSMEAAFLTDSISYLGALMFLLLAALRHWKAVKQGVHLDEVVIDNHRVIDFRLRTIRPSKRGFSRAIRATEWLALIYLLAGLVFLAEAPFDIFSNFDKVQFLKTINPIDNKYISIFVLLLSVFAVDSFLNLLLTKYSKTDILMTDSERIADSKTSAKLGVIERGGVQEKTMPKPSNAYQPISVEGYLKFKGTQNYRDYLAKQADMRLKNSNSVHPDDGGPTDEAILAEHLANMRKK